MNYRKFFRAGLENIQPTVTTNIFTKISNHQNFSYGFGAPDVATN
jgi:hypothetical protein